MGAKMFCQGPMGCTPTRSTTCVGTVQTRRAQSVPLGSCRPVVPFLLEQDLACRGVAYSAKVSSSFQTGQQWQVALTMSWQLRFDVGGQTVFGGSNSSSCCNSGTAHWHSALNLLQTLQASGGQFNQVVLGAGGAPAINLTTTLGTSARGTQWQRAFWLLQDLHAPPAPGLLRLLHRSDGGEGFGKAVPLAVATVRFAHTVNSQMFSQPRRIPNVIHKVLIVDGMELPPLTPAMTEAINTFRELNPGFQLKLFSGTDCIAYISKHFTTDILAAFHALQPYAYKCDLFRYLLLLREGGYYSDMRQVCLQSLECVFPPNTEWFSPLERFATVAGESDIYMNNAFIAAVPGHPWLAAAIQEVLKSIRTRHYGKSSLDPTGPGALGRACCSSLLQRPHTWLVGQHRQNGGCGYIESHGGKRFILTKYWKENGERFRPGEWGEEDGGGQSYNELWEQKQVYVQ